MRKLVVTENITVDGVIDSDGGWFDPAGQSEADLSDLTEALNRQMTAADAFLVGRLTFEQMRSFWPKQTDDETGVSDYLNSVAKYVVSETMRDPEWANSRVLTGPLDEEIRGLKGQSGSDIVCTGSITLVHGLIEAGLVDEYRLFTYPVVRGSGRRLFESGVDVADLELVQTQPFRSGVVLLVYRVR